MAKEGAYVREGAWVKSFSSGERNREVTEPRAKILLRSKAVQRYKSVGSQREAETRAQASLEIKGQRHKEYLEIFSLL